MNTRKLLFIALTGILIVVIIGLFILFSFSNSSKIPNPTTNPTPSLINNGATGPLKLISSSPQNNSINIPLNNPITMIFNNSIENISPSVSIFPSTQFTFTPTQNTITITPTSAFIPSTIYVVTVSLGDQTFFTTFTSLGPTPTSAPGSRPVDQANEDTATTKQNYPDIYLKNFTPYESSEFSVSANYVNPPSGHFQFTVTQKTSRGKTAFINWVKQDGLNDEQISKLDIIYK